MSFHEIDNLLNKKSGFAGLSGVADLRSVLQRREQGDERASAAYAVSLLTTSAKQHASEAALQHSTLSMQGTDRQLCPQTSDPLV